MLQVMSLLQVVVYTASSKLEHQSRSEQGTGNPLILPVNEGSGGVSKDPALPEADSKQENSDAAGSTSGGKRSHDIRNIFLQLPESVLCNLCALLGCEGYSSSNLTSFKLSALSYWLYDDSKLVVGSFLPYAVTSGWNNF